MKSFVKNSFMLLAALMLVLSACNETSKTEDVGKGTLSVKITDAPFPLTVVDKVMVTIDKVEIRSSAPVTVDGEEPSYESLFTVVSDKVQEFDLLQLRNGITSDVLEIEIGVGSYDMIRMHVIASKVILKDGSEFDMKIPSGSTSGLKIRLVPELVVESGIVNEVLIDFDLSKSFVVMGNHRIAHGIKGFIFKPVLRAMCVRQSGIISGNVFENETTPLGEAHVQILRADTVFSSALTNVDGSYALIGVPEGTYQMICEKEGYTDVTVDEVAVKAREKTVQDFTLTLQ